MKNLNYVPFILILNGTSSAGKSSIFKILAKKIQMSNVSFLDIDTFVDILPQSFVGKANESSVGFRFYSIGGKCKIQVGDLGNLVVKQMHNLARAILRSGSSVVMDHVILTKPWARDLDTLRKTGARVINVLITCDIEKLEMREYARGNRFVGLAKGLKYVENIIPKYNLVIDTTLNSPKKAAGIILRYLDDNEVFRNHANVT